MRAVAGRFGVTPMALYHYVADREELVRLVANRIGSLVQPEAPPGASWERQARAWAVAQRDTMRAHPGLAAWLMENGPAGVEAYRLLELLASALVEGGFDDARQRTERRNRSQAFVAGLSEVDPVRHPTAARVGPEFFTLSMQEIFDLGLDSILAGLPARTA
jgi:AcrR family transcriptional regulator